MATKLYHPLVAVDVVVFGVDPDDDGASALRVLLIERKDPPGKGLKVLPGGLIKKEESLEQAAARVLREKTALPHFLQPTHLEQLYTLGDPLRDPPPRERSIAVGYMALVRRSTSKNGAPVELSAYKPEWVRISIALDKKVTKFAFDHRQLLEKAYERLSAKVRYAPIGFELLPEEFSLGQLHRLYEAILGREIDKRNFYKKILSLGMLEPTGSSDVGAGKGRPARLYRFDKSAYADLTKKGINFEV